MGISSKKSTTATQSTSTQTPNVPQWGMDSLQGLNGQIQNIAKADPNSFVTGPSALQQQAFDGASNLGGWQSLSDQAGALASSVGAAGPSSANFTSSGPTAQASSAGVFDGGIAQYLNPETDKVVNTTLADFDQNAGQTRAAQAAQGALANAFGGSRWGIQEGETEGQLSRARATTDATLRSNAYNDATALANDDANRRQATELANAAATNQNAQFNAGAKNQNSQFNATENDANLNRQSGVAGLLSQLSSAFNTNQLADVSTQSQLGDTQHQLAQDKATAPISLAQTVAALLGQNQLPLVTGQTVKSNGTSSTTSTPSTWDQISTGVQTAAKLAALFSDRRLKRDVVKLGERPDGLGVYLYRYLWSPIQYVGVMAQEVLKVKPEAVITHPSGFLMVNYGAL